MMDGAIWLASALCAGLLAGAAWARLRQPKPPLRLLETRLIWDRAPHNAFTDLIRFHDRWFCVFREGSAHISPDGALRILTSVDGHSWTSAALLTSPDSDLRDGKLSVAPDGRLMLSGAETLHNRSTHAHQSLAWFSGDGYRWEGPLPIGEPDFWIWRITWHEGTAYGIGYDSRKAHRSIRLYRSPDGRRFEPLVPRLLDVGYPNESCLVFDGNTAYCLLRRDGQPSSGLLGISSPPYTQWSWQDLGVRIGGPCMIRLPDGRLLAAVRLYDGNARTSLCWIDPPTGTLREALRLPSGGDTSYAGMVLDGNTLWVSYYSTHENKTAIYFSRVTTDLPE